MSTKKSSHAFIHMNDKHWTSPRLLGWCTVHTLVRLPPGPVSMSIHMCVAQSEVPHLSLTKKHRELIRTCSVSPWAHKLTALSTRESNKSTKIANTQRASGGECTLCRLWLYKRPLEFAFAYGWKCMPGKFWYSNSTKDIYISLHLKATNKKLMKATDHFSTISKKLTL